MEKPEIRLRLLQTLVPVASRHDLTNPEQVVRIATVLEGYVAGSLPESPPENVARGSSRGKNRKRNRADNSIMD